MKTELPRIKPIQTPTYGSVTLSLFETIRLETFSTTSAIGAKINVPTHQISDTELEVNLNGLSIGLYILHLNGKQWKIIKE